MKKIERSKINIYPKRITIYTLSFILCALISCATAFGICYSYFNAKVSAEPVVTAGVLSYEYIKNTEADTDLEIYLLRDDEELLLKNVDDSQTYYTYILPGDEIILKGQIKNDGTMPSYGLIKFDVAITYDNDGQEASVTSTEWFNFSGTKVVDSNSDGRYDTASTLLDVDETINLADNSNDISYVVNSAYDNSFANKSVSITITIYGYQTDGVSLENGYTDLGVQVTNMILAG